MNKQGLNEKIRNRIGRNLYYMSCVVTNDNVRIEFEKNNEILNEIVVGMRQEKSSEDYERGLNDAWDLAQRITGAEHPATFNRTELAIIFGFRSPSDIFDHYSYQEALAKLKEFEVYKEKKAEEEAKLVPGDVVEYGSGPWKNTGVFLGESEASDQYWVWVKTCNVPQQLSRKIFKLRKTGQHVDFEGWRCENE